MGEKMKQGMGKLNKEQREDVSDLQKYYRYIYLCAQCEKIYGSDKKERGFICPKCANMIR